MTQEVPLCDAAQVFSLVIQHRDGGVSMLPQQLQSLTHRVPCM